MKENDSKKVEELELFLKHILIYIHKYLLYISL